MPRVARGWLVVLLIGLVSADEQQTRLFKDEAVERMATSHREQMERAMESGDYDEALSLVDEQMERASVDAPSDFALHVSLQYDKLSCLRAAKRYVEFLYEAHRLRSLFVMVGFPTKGIDSMAALAEAELKRRGPYEMLQLEPGASRDQIERSHLKLSQLLGKRSKLDQWSVRYLGGLLDKVHEAYDTIKL